MAIRGWKIGAKLSSPSALGIKHARNQSVGFTPPVAVVQALSCKSMMSLSRTAWALAALLTLSACGLLSGRSYNLISGNTLRLSTLVRFDSSVKNAALHYDDACGAQQTLPIDGRVRAKVLSQLGTVFDTLYLEETVGTRVPDGTLNLGLGLQEAEVRVPRASTRTYPAAVTLGAEIVYQDPSGNEVYTKQIKVTRTGDVSAQDKQCAIVGLDDVANEAVALLAEGITKTLGTSTSLQQFAEQRRQGGGGAAAAGQKTAGKSQPVAQPSPLQPPVAVVVPAAGAAVPPDAAPAADTSPPAAAESTEFRPTKLTFRAMVRDENRNHVLEEGEQLTVEVDVTNEGPGLAEGVDVQISGTAEVVEHFAGPLRIGDLPAGEHRRLTIAAKIPQVEGIEQAEVKLTIRATASAIQVAPPKKFLMAVRRPDAEEVEVLSVSIDQPPKRIKGFEQPQALGIAIGVGAYRDSTLAASRFAVRDATVMAKYLQNVTGVPAKQLKVLTDKQAGRDDLAALFESWLPKQVKASTTLYLYFSGRAAVDPESGAVFLVPYDGKPAVQERLFSLRRLHAALGRLPVERAVLFLEVSVEPTGGAGTGQSLPRWDPDSRDIAKGKLIQVIGNTAIQDAHEFYKGQHGLFTYFVLRGLRGEADAKQNGRVLLRELCQYVEAQVSQMAQAEFGNQQEAVCRPSPGAILELEKQPIARLK